MSSKCDSAYPELLARIGQAATAMLQPDGA